MANVLRTVYTNFSSGEINPLLATRTDASAYTNGAKTLRNWYLLDEGGLMRRPGTTYKATLPGDSRIIPFIFSNLSPPAHKKGGGCGGARGLKKKKKTLKF